MNNSVLKHKITLRRPIYSKNEFSSNSEITYSDFKTIWAGIIYIGGNRSIQNYELFASQTVQFQIRYRTDFNESFQIRFNNKIYNILNIKEAGFKDSVVITAELQQ